MNYKTKKTLLSITIIFCFTVIGISSFCQTDFEKNRYIASITPSEIVAEFPYIKFWSFLGIKDFNLDANYIKQHKIKTITERKYEILKKGKHKPLKNETRILYFNENGYPIKIEDGKYIIIEFEYDNQNNLKRFCAFNDFPQNKREPKLSEIIFDNTYENELLVNQEYNHISTTYDKNYKLQDSYIFGFTHQISYDTNDSIDVITLCKSDTLIRKGHKHIIYPNKSKKKFHEDLSTINKDTLLLDILSESDLWSLKSIFNKEYDSLGYLIKIDAVVYKENTLENYDTLFYYTRKTLDTISEYCPHLWVEVVTKGTRPEQHPDSIRYIPEYRFDTMRVQYQFYYMDNFNYTSNTNMIQGYILFDTNGKKIDQFEKNKEYCDNIYYKNGLIDKQVFTLSPFWVEPEDQEWKYVIWFYDYLIEYNYEFY